MLMPPSPLPSARPLNVPQAYAQATEAHRQGRLAEAERLYAAILAVRPDHFDALHLLGVIKLARGQPAEALNLIAAAMRPKAPSPQIWLNHGLVLNALNRPTEAVESFERAIKLKSKFPEAHNNRGVVLANLGRNEDALESYKKALAIKPNYADAHCNMGNALKQLGRHDEALKSYERALQARPNYPDVFYNRAVMLKELGRAEEALANYDRAIALRPEMAEAHCNRGVALHHLRRLDEALASYDRAIAIRPDYAEAHYNRGMTLEDMWRHEDALAGYDRALALRPDLAEALSNRGNVLNALKRVDEALASYERALALRPTLIEALSNRGMTLHELHRYDEALVMYDRALAVAHDHVNALNNRGTTLQEMKRFEEALAAFERLHVVQPDHPHALSGAAKCAICVCDWERSTALAPQIEAQVKAGVPVSPFVMLGLSGDPALQLQSAKNYVAHRIPKLPAPMWNGERWTHDKIRVAYLSADFKTHATAFLMAELFERHDREKFEWHAISFSIDDGSEMRARLVAAFDRFHDVRGKSNTETAQLIRDLEIDIAVDLKGYTQEARPEILSHRPAPVAASYIGYPGSVGAPFIDYIIGDPIVTPFEHQPFFTEQIVQLPDSYQVNDTHRRIAEHAPTRAEAGLPERGFVFCSFNNNWKIAPDVFDAWMRLLQHVEGSVLWLLRDNDSADRNLRAQAARRGIDPSRLVFADRMLPDEHLARHRLADLFLDTLPCNAHTTASDALWAGLPVLTCPGGAFAGRVAASLVSAAGLPELVAPDLASYEALALKLAREPAQLTALKGRLARNRGTCALFDPTRFARHIEAAYMTMWQTWQRGDAPKGFSFAPIG
jgi:protein O-GlcNAc transferase